MSWKLRGGGKNSNSHQRQRPIISCDSWRLCATIIRNYRSAFPPSKKAVAPRLRRAEAAVTRGTLDAKTISSHRHAKMEVKKNTHCNTLVIHFLVLFSSSAPSLNCSVGLCKEGDRRGEISVTRFCFGLRLPLDLFRRFVSRLFLCQPVRSLKPFVSCAGVPCLVSALVFGCPGYCQSRSDWFCHVGPDDRGPQKKKQEGGKRKVAGTKCMNANTWVHTQWRWGT